MPTPAEIARAHAAIAADIATLEAISRRHFSGQVPMPINAADDALEDLCGHLEDALDQLRAAFVILDDALSAADDAECGADNSPITYAAA
jgi:hypothetical protein